MLVYLSPCIEVSFSVCTLGFCFDLYRCYSCLTMVLERSGLVNELSILAEKSRFWFGFFLLLKCLPYIGLTEKCLPSPLLNVSLAYSTALAYSFFSHFHSQLRPWIQFAGVWWRCPAARCWHHAAFDGCESSWNWRPWMGSDAVYVMDSRHQTGASKTTRRVTV